MEAQGKRNVAISHSKASRYGSVAFALLGLTALAVACSETRKPENNIVAEMKGAPAAVPAFSGFLGDYSKLQRGNGEQAAYRYINPSANWSQYSKVLILPVTFWGSETTTVSAADQQELTNYFYKALQDNLSKNYTVVDEPGPNVMTVAVALVDPQSATPVLRTVSVIVPQARLMNRVKELATGSFSFVGGARAEGKITDSQTGEILAEAVDERLGGNAIQTAATWQWGDAKRAMDYWSEHLDSQLGAWTHGTASITSLSPFGG